MARRERVRARARTSSTLASRVAKALGANKTRLAETASACSAASANQISTFVPIAPRTNSHHRPTSPCPASLLTQTTHTVSWSLQHDDPFTRHDPWMTQQATQTPHYPYRQESEPLLAEQASSSLRPVSIHEVPDEYKEVLQRRQKLDASIAECEIAMGMPRIDTRINHPQPPGKTPLYEDPRCPVRQVEESLGDLLAVRNSQLGRTSLPVQQQQRLAEKKPLDPEHEKQLLEIEQSVVTTTALHKRHQSEKQRLQGGHSPYPMMQPSPHTQMYHPASHQTQQQPMQMPVQQPQDAVVPTRTTASVPTRKATLCANNET